MNCSLPFVEDGPARYLAPPDLAEKSATVHAQVAARYAERLVSAGWIERIWLRWQMHCEIVRECRRLLPSDQTLWACREDAG
jgi:hypothetical protein